ncbi:hypothetical protein [Phenylobacterium sp.]|uniref:hypothetical protein n=1 Tax=Phenylobacterium sp. TaxID=1871053 RepID=UPI002FCB1522
MIAGRIPPAAQKGLGAAVAALLTFMGLWAVGRAPDQGERLHALEQTAATLSARPAALPATRTRTPLCRAPLAAASAELEDQLRRDAAASGATVEAMTLTPGAAGTPTDLTAATLDLTLSGDEAAITRFLKAAVDQRAPVFLQDAEITAAPNDLKVQMRGRLLCRR